MSASPVAESSATRVNLSLWTLFLGAFVVGSAELVVVGIRNLIAGDLDVSVGTAGTLVTAYALGISIGGPVLIAVTGLIICAIALPLSWATSFLKLPAQAETPQPKTVTDSAAVLADI